ncbi:Transposon Ty3-I Gag-Pol polyprotein [Araneus ventricosus]|uniref:RNA-directed DNA polymerase n=1 Tax=Araneus ventricosus TaxID=182803 RepID=A0A4Y2BXR7_ARAVE|nr:Transposon Ty3-I Gag-Pol polyprotein [Araneus ventricosus]GBL96420.1 Transposon Ty3-I Gag-Pol polyprotein [Araneus ventricosus]
MANKNDKTQIHHVNLLKPYHQRPEKINLLISERKETPETESDELGIPYPISDPNVHDFEEIIRDSALEERLSFPEIEELRKMWKPYRTSQRQTEILKAEIKRMLDLKIIEIGQSDYTSPMILIEAVGREPRPCIYYRRLNSSIRNQYFPLPNIKERVERVSAAKFITVIDLAKGYWQIPLSKRAQRYAAFVTNYGTYVPLRMPFGLVNAPYFFSKLMSQVLENCESFAVSYLDDIAIYSNNWEDHLKHVNEVLKRIGDANLTIKPFKCKFAQNRTKYLGHVVGSSVRTPAEVKIKAVLDFPTPTSKTQIRAFLGLAGYYAHYVKNLSVIAAPLTNVLKGKVKRESIIWTKECNQAFEELKRRLTQKPVLYAPV